MVKKKINGQSKEVLENVIAAFGIRGASMLVNFVLMPAYMNFFQDQVVLGVWFTILSIFNGILTLDLGLGNGIRNKLPKAFVKNDKKLVAEIIASGYCIICSFVISLTIVGNIFIFYINWNKVLNITTITNSVLKSSIYIIFNGIMVQFILRTVCSILYALQKSAIVNVMSLISNVLIYIALFILKEKSIEKSLIYMSWIHILAVNIPLIIVTIGLFKNQLKDLRINFSSFSKKCAIDILKTGLILFWLQMVFTAINYSKEFFISLLSGPQFVVEYQAYFRVFNLWASIISLAMSPIWSAVTKAKERKDYLWIRKLSHVLYVLCLVSCIVEFLIIPFFPNILLLWLGESEISMNVFYMVIMAINSIIFIIHHVNTSLGNGMSYLKVQIKWVTIGAIINLPMSIIFADIFNSWIGVIIANIISLLPFEIIEVISFDKYLRSRQSEKISIN